MKTHFNRIAFLLIPCLMMILNACTPPINGGVVTWTPSPTATATCAPDVGLSTPDGWGASSRQIVILYDPRSTLGETLEIGNGERTQNISTFLTKVIPMLLKPGDNVAVFQLGYSAYDNGRVMRIDSSVMVPQLYNTPTHKATLTPLSPTTVPTPGYAPIATANYVRPLLTARANTEQANDAIYHCQVDFWNRVVQLTATPWQLTATASTGVIGDEIRKDFQTFYQDTSRKEVPYHSDELNNGGVYYGLNFASTVFQGNCKDGKECLLIIIDDLHLWKKDNPDHLPIDLKGVSVYSIMPQCNDMADPECTELMRYWNAEFDRFGVQTHTYWNGVHSGSNLLTAIGS